MGLKSAKQYFDRLPNVSGIVVLIQQADNCDSCESINCFSIASQ